MSNILVTLVYNIHSKYIFNAPKIFFLYFPVPATSSQFFLDIYRSTQEKGRLLADFFNERWLLLSLTKYFQVWYDNRFYNFLAKAVLFPLSESHIIREIPWISEENYAWWLIFLISFLDCKKKLWGSIWQESETGTTACNKSLCVSMSFLLFLIISLRNYFYLFHFTSQKINKNS